MKLSEATTEKPTKMKLSDVQETKPEESGFGDSVKEYGKSFLESLPAAGGGLAGAEAGAAIGSFAGPVGTLAGGLIGGIGGAYLGEKAGETAGEMIPEETKKEAGFGEQQRKQERKQSPLASALGTHTPDVLALGPSLVRATRYGNQLIDKLTGKPIEAQAQKVMQVAKSAEEQGGKALTAAEQEQAALQTKQQTKTLKQLAEEQTRADIAAKAGKKAETQKGKALAELPGVVTKVEGEAYKPIPKTASDVGNYIREQAEKFVDAIKKQRNAAAKTSFDNAKNEAALNQSLGRYVDTKPLTSEIDRLIDKGGTTDYIQSLTRLKNDISATKDFEGLEIIRRKLGDAAFGLPEEGYKAIGQHFSEKMYDDLAGQMRLYSGDFDKYLEDYKRLSKTIESHGTKVGKSLTETQDAGGKYYAKTAEQVAKDIFKSPENYQIFVDSVGGNKQITEAAARRYFAGLLESANTPAAVSKIFKDNRALLEKIDPKSEGLRKELTDRYLRTISQSERRAGEAEKVVNQAGETQKTIAAKAKDFDKEVSDKLKGIAGSKTIFSDSVTSLASAKPGKAMDAFESSLSKIRAAEEKSGVQILPESEIQNLRNQVQQLDKLYDAQQRNMLAAKITSRLLGVGGAFYTGKEVLDYMSK
jgi:hypothetical protein